MEKGLLDTVIASSGIKTRYELAKRTGVSEATLWAIDRGRRVRLATYEKVANELGVPLSSLFKMLEDASDKRAS